MATAYLITIGELDINGIMADEFEERLLSNCYLIEK